MRKVSPRNRATVHACTEMMPGVAEKKKAQQNAQMSTKVQRNEPDVSGPSADIKTDHNIDEAEMKACKVCICMCLLLL